MNSWLKHSIYFLIGFYYTQSTLFSGELRHPFQGIRNLGMGNVGVASSYDENALIYNPAGLAAVDDMIVSITADVCLLYTSPSPRDAHESRMPSSA